MKTTRNGVLAQTSGEAERERCFLRARRSTRLWPVDKNGNNIDNCRRFLVDWPAVPQATADGIDIEEAYFVDQVKRSRVENEAVVVFSTSETKDMVRPMRRDWLQAGGKAGMRMEIPDHLRGTFKLFEQHGGQLKARYKEGLQRSIKFDDVNQGLMMDVKLPHLDKWQRIRQHKIRQLARVREERETKAIGADLLQEEMTRGKHCS